MINRQIRRAQRAMLVSASAVVCLARILPAQAPASLSKDDIVSLVRIEAQIGQARDSMQAELAKAGNTKTIFQQELRDKLNTQIAEILHHGGMTQEEYQRRTFIVSTDAASRKMYDSVMVAVTGQPIPGQILAGAAGGRGGGAPPTQKVAVPAGPAGVHIGHVVNAFNDTPNGEGLLPTAMAEARIAAQHATLAMRNATSLDAMKLHAGHVMNALDPAEMPMGPGLGYGVKRAATGVVTHIELAAKADGASPNIIMHSNHIATSARNTITRADQLMALCKQVRAATSVSDAAALVSQMASLADQLIAGVDKNGDGRITWEEGEGGLQQAQEHVNLMLAAEKTR